MNQVFAYAAFNLYMWNQSMIEEKLGPKKKSEKNDIRCQILCKIFVSLKLSAIW